MWSLLLPMAKGVVMQQLNTPTSNGDSLLPTTNNKNTSPRKYYDNNYSLNSKGGSGRTGSFGKLSLLLCFISFTLFGLCMYLIFTRGKCATRSDYEALQEEHELLKMKLDEAKSISLNLKAKHQRRSKVLEKHSFFFFWESNGRHRKARRGR